ncbi:MAG: SGNH/GDSL hydrolase family protein [Gemmataceae bacterium]
MNRIPKSWPVIGLAVLVGLVAAYFLRPRSAEPQPPAGPPIRVLFIGNSYTETNDLPGMCTRLVRSEDRPLHVESIVKGGYSLHKHWEDGEARAAIRRGNWDFVVLQDQSEMPVISPGKTIESGKLFADEIKKAGARTLLFVTWPKKNMGSNQDQILNTYTRLAQETGARLVPVGPVWMQAGFAKVMFYRADESHPSPLGTYIAACVFYAVMRDKDPQGLPFEGIVTEAPYSERPAEEIRRYQEMAWKTALKLADPSPLPPPEE